VAVVAGQATASGSSMKHCSMTEIARRRWQMSIARLMNRWTLR
jgi:hypothetical protein